MIGYVCIGTNDMARAAKFYDGLMATLGAKRQWETERFIAWATAADAPQVLLCKPHDGKPATFGNGMMVALRASSKAAVDTAYQKAIALGGKDEGPAGPRGDSYYGGYFRDLDGNKLVVYFGS